MEVNLQISQEWKNLVTGKANISVFRFIIVTHILVLNAELMKE